MLRTMRKATILGTLLGLLIAGRSNAEDKDPLRETALKLNEITGTAPMEGRLRQLIKDEAGTKKLVAVAVKMAKEKNQPFNYNGAVILAKAAYVLNDYESAKVFYKVASDEALKLESGEKTFAVYNGLIDVFIKTKNYSDAVKACDEFLKMDDSNNDTIKGVKLYFMERMVQALTKQGKTEQALNYLDKLIETYDNRWLFVQLKGDVYREAGEYEDAVKNYEEALKELSKLKDIDDDRRDRNARGIRYALSGVYVEMNKIDKAAAELQILLKQYPKNATFMNDLGYIWADHDMNLDESEKLIRQALEVDRDERKKIEDLSAEEDVDNAAYLDSLGWVLFKKKEYKEAKKYFLEAIKQKEGQHIEIMDHLADVHMALGEKKDAIKVWEEALKKNDETSKREKERRIIVEKKLKKAQSD